MTCALHSQSYTFLLIEVWGIPLGENVTRGHSEVYGWLWCKREYPQTETGKKLSVKLLWDRYVYSSHIDKTFFLLHSFETVMDGFAKGHSRAHSGLGERGDNFR